MSNLKNLLTRYGVNCSEVFPRFLNDERFYLQCFDLYMQDENLDKLEKALAENNLDDAFAFAHTLKGVTGNMGFAKLYEAVCAVVEPLRIRKTDVDYDALLAAVKTEAGIIAALKTEADKLS